jgi:transcriptional regulator with XRE-family HTH domain
MESSAIRRRLKAERIAQGLSQAALGAKCGLPTSTISALERGYVYPWPAWRKRLAAALKMSERELFPDADGGKASA